MDQIESTIACTVIWEVKPQNKDTVNIDFVYNFFTRSVQLKPKAFVADTLSLEKMRFNIKGEIFDKSKDYKNDFILETEEEKNLSESW